ncbi:MAG: cytochrome b/b6 domain-containing protein [Sphingomonas sp.]|nr:cytochrome b/b6 domain-containing protein [Gammaproteobacteria bacterium]MBA3730777.1 cytochrome b/b6 domain-containing protein [Sphingomonas sp.]
MSGLQIFNAHPSLYWGKSSYTGKPPILSMSAKQMNGETIGVTRLLGREFNTTGVFGASKMQGQWLEHGFPAWATVPSSQSLALGRRWHFFFAWIFVINGLLYVAYSFFSRHFSHDLAPTKTDLRGIGRSIKDHLVFRHPRGEAAKRYNALQKLTYLAVIFGLLPLVILMGWALSLWLDSLIPGWLDLFGGRQSARTLHFLAAVALVAFVVIHVFEVIVTGFWNNLRSMISGRYRIKKTTNDSRQ